MLAGLFRGAAPEVRDTALSDPRWWGGASTGTWAGANVTTDTSLQLMAVYGSVRLICDSISTLPVDVYRKVGDGREEVALPPWLRQPTTRLNFTEWCGQVLASLLLHGNAYLAVTRNQTGAIVEIAPLDPRNVRLAQEGTQVVTYVNGQRARPSDEIVHIKGLMLPGALEGMSPVEYARQSIGLGLAATQYGGEFFEGDGNMPGVIEMPGTASPDTKRDMAEAWRRKRSKSGKGLPGMLDGGATWKPTGVTNEQAQFLATRQFTAAEIAGQMFLIDPSDLGIPVEGSSLTYANLEQRNARRVQVTLLPWMIRVETAISALLSQPRYMKFNVSGLLRGDTRARWDTYYLAEQINKSAAERGAPEVLATEEMRDLEDMGKPPTPPVAPNPAPEVPNAA